MNPAVVQFDKTVFGDDADIFRPEHWLEGDAVEMDRYIMHFGMGARTCLGKHVSGLHLNHCPGINLVDCNV